MSACCISYAGCSTAPAESQAESSQQSITEKSSNDEITSVPETSEKASTNTENNNPTTSTNESDTASKSSNEGSKTDSSAQSNNTSENFKTSQNSQTSKPNQSSKTSDESKPSQHSQPSQSSQSSQNSQTSKPAEASKPAQTSKPAETSKPTETSKQTETSKPSQTSTPSQPSKPATVNVSSISLNKSSMTLTVGESSKLTATISPSNATNKGFSWVNSNTAVVSVDSNGNVKALKAGTASITAKTGNGKTAVCNVTVKAKEVSQPAKKKVTQIGGFGQISNLRVSTTPTTAHWGVRIYPKNADTTNLRISISDNLKKYVKISNLKKDSGDYQTYDGYDFDAKIEKVTQDITGTYTVSCDGISSTGTITLQCEYDSRYINYYPPFTKAKRDAIIKDMRAYGESLGAEWNTDLYVKWDYNKGKYHTNATFTFPHSANPNNGIVGKALHDNLIEENFDATYKAWFLPYGAQWSDTYFKVEAWQDPNNMEEWDFYILVGEPGLDY